MTKTKVGTVAFEVEQKKNGISGRGDLPWVKSVALHNGDRGSPSAEHFFHAPRSPSSPLAPALVPTTPSAAVWGGRGTVARPPAVAWRSGEPSQNGAFYIGTVTTTQM